MKTAAFILICLYGMAGLASFISPYSPYDQDRANVLRPPTYWSLSRDSLQLFPVGNDGRRHLFGAGAGKFFLLGTDMFGRDLFARICYGARISLTVAVFGTALTLLAGTLIGITAALAGGWIDSLCMELANFVLALPTLFVLLAVRALFSWETTTPLAIYLLLIAILALTGWADVARVVRTKLIVMRSEDYFLASVALGASPLRLFYRHLVPGLVPYWVVQGTLLIPIFLMSEVTLSFLGAGIPEPDASWGNILHQGLSLSVLSRSPWILFPGLFVVAAVLSFNGLGEALRRRVEKNGAGPDVYSTAIQRGNPAN